MNNFKLPSSGILPHTAYMLLNTPDNALFDACHIPSHKPHKCLHTSGKYLLLFRYPKSLVELLHNR